MQSAQKGQVATTTLNRSEREWIRRQGMTARLLAEEQRRARAQLRASVVDELKRVRELYTSRRVGR